MLLDEHGFGKIPDNNRAGARRGGEAEIVAACLDDRWPDAAIECMTTRPSALSCVGQLTTFQQKSFDAHLHDWERKWLVAAGDEPGEEESATEKTKPRKDDAPREEWVPCEIAEPAEFAPVIGAKAHARQLAVAFRKRALDQACYRWAKAPTYSSSIATRAELPGLRRVAKARSAVPTASRQVRSARRWARFALPTLLLSLARLRER